MKKLINESFTVKNATYKAKDGRVWPIAYIDSTDPQETKEHKDKIKEFGAKWFKLTPTKSVWAWFITDERVYTSKIKPCLEYLKSVEKDKTGDEVESVIQILNQLIQDVNSGEAFAYDEDVKFDAAELSRKLDDFRRELVSIMSDKEFKEKLAPIIKRRNAQGHKFSLRNAILIYIQDPEATLVKSRTNWAKLNRTVKPNAPAIALYCPNGSGLSSSAKRAITDKFLQDYGVSSEKELPVGVQEQLRVKRNARVGDVSFSLRPNFFDVRFTEQISGKEDYVGDITKTEDLTWYDNTSEETEETKMYCDAVIACAIDKGIKVNFVKTLGGARGVSKSGEIDVLEGEPKNLGFFNDFTHEFAHELLHQRFLKDKDPNGIGQHFVGTKPGRAAVEQQAELCAWIVLRYFGFESNTSINYVGLWGMDEDNAPKVFDTVASAASELISCISTKTESSINESKNYLNEMELTGLDVAKMIGCEDVYLKGLKKNKANTLKRQEFQESFNKTLNKLNDVRNRNEKLKV